MTHRLLASALFAGLALLAASAVQARPPHRVVRHVHHHHPVYHHRHHPHPVVRR